MSKNANQHAWLVPETIFSMKETNEIYYPTDPALGAAVTFDSLSNSPAKKLLGLTLLILLTASQFAGCRPNAGGGINSGTGGWPPTSSSQTSVISSSLDVVKIKAESLAIPMGGNADARVVLTIAPGFHINANPATFPYLIATRLEVGNGYGMITAGKPVYPIAQTRQFQFSEKPLAVYQDEVNLSLPLTATLRAARGPVSLPISVTVQACDEEKCYPPGVLNSMIPVEVK